MSHIGEKTREQKERQEREARNQELAGSSYTIPVPEDFMSGGGIDDDLSGVPWGGLNIQHMVAQGHKSASQQGGSRQDASDQYNSQQQYYDPQYMSGSFGYGGGYDATDDRYFDTSASSSSPSYLSYDTFSPGDSGSSSGTMF